MAAVVSLQPPDSHALSRHQGTNREAAGRPHLPEVIARNFRLLTLVARLVPATRSRASLVAIGLVLATAAPAAADEVVFASGFEGGTTCSWSRASGSAIYCWAVPGPANWSQASSWRGGAVPPWNADVGVDLPGVATQVVADISVTVHGLIVNGDLSIPTGVTLYTQGSGSIRGSLALGKNGTLDVEGTGARFDALGPVPGAGGTLHADYGGELTLPQLAGASSMSILSTNGSSVAAPVLATATNTILQITKGSSFTAPLLSAFTKGQLSLNDAGSILDCPNLSNVDDTRIGAFSGAALDLEQVFTYTFSQPPPSNTNWCGFDSAICAKDGGASVSLPVLYKVRAIGQHVELRTSNNAGLLDLPMLKEFDLENGGTVSLVASEPQAQLDLLSLTDLPQQVSLGADNGGDIEAPALESVEGSLGAGIASSNVPPCVLDVGGIDHIAGQLLISGMNLTLPLITDLADADVEVENGYLGLPHVATVERSTVAATWGGTLDLPSLTQASDTSLTVGGSAYFVAESLSSFVRGHIAAFESAGRPASVLSIPVLTDIDDTTLLVDGSDGPAHLSLPAVTSYEFHGDACESPPCIEMQASESGAVLELPHLETVIADAPSLDFSTSSELYGYPSGGGRIDLPALTTVETFESGSVSFTAGGTPLYDPASPPSIVNLDSLTTATASTTLAAIDGGELDANALSTMPGAVVISGEGSLVSAGSLSTFSGSLTVTGVTASLPGITQLDAASLVVNGAATLALPGVQVATGSSLTVEAGSSVQAAALTQFTDGRLELVGAGSQIDAASLANVDDTTLSASSHASLTLPSVTSYEFTQARCDLPGCAEVETSEDAVIVLPALTNVAADGVELDLIADDATASDSAQLDLSSLAAAVTANGGSIHFGASGAGALVDLSGLVSYDPSRVFLDSTGGGQILH